MYRGLGPGQCLLWNTARVLRMIRAMTSSAPPAALDAGDLPALEARFLALEQRPIEDRRGLEAWLVDESDLLARIAAETARRYIAMTCHTEDAQARERFLSYERDVTPRVKVLADRLDQKFLACPHLAELDPRRYAVLIRRRKTARAIFREANTALQAKESELQTQQQELMGSLLVPFAGKDHTIQQMAVYQERQDRDLREQAFRATLAARRRTWEPLEQIYDQLIALRTTIAANAGFQSYVPFRFQELQRFDYSPETCRRFHAAIEQAVVPAVQRLNAKRCQQLGIPALRPWDLEVDPDGAPPLVAFQTEPELRALVKKVFAAVDARFVPEFGLLEQNQLLDLMSRKGKAPGGYQYTLEDVRLPFIFANAVGLHHDVQTLLHEGGHAFHAILSREDPLLAYRDAPIEFAETASMSMELMGLENLGVVYGQDDVRRVQKHHLEGILRILGWIATIDAFQLWVYEHPQHTRAERQQHWLALRARFAPGLDYTGIEDALAWQWTSQPHLFVHPLYYIEYGIAQLAALQLWQRYRKDPAGAVAAYRRALALGGTRPLPELFAAAEVKFDVGEAMLRSLVADIEQVIR